MSLIARLELHRAGFHLDAMVTAPPRRITVLFGPSGSGKSTLLKCIAGLVRGQGSCHLNGRPWQDDRTQAWVPPERRRLGMVFQDGVLFEHLTVAGNLAYPARRRGTRQRIPEIVELLELGPLQQRHVLTLSGGERRRVALGRALLADPALLLLDEPLAGLDGPRRWELLPYLERVVETCAAPMLYVTHDLEELSRLADQIIVMQDGRTAESGPVETMLSRLDHPLAERDDAMVVLTGHTAQRLKEDGLMAVKLGEQQVLLPTSAARQEGPVRLRIHARDVSLALDPPGRTSVLNVLRGTVQEMRPLGDDLVMVAVTVHGQAVLSRISRYSAQRLELQPGTPVYVQIKAVALV